MFTALVRLPRTQAQALAIGFGHAQRAFPPRALLYFMCNLSYSDVHSKNRRKQTVKFQELGTNFVLAEPWYAAKDRNT